MTQNVSRIRHYPKHVADPTAGLRKRRVERGLPTGRVAPLEWWQVIELSTARQLSTLRVGGAV